MALIVLCRVKQQWNLRVALSVLLTRRCALNYYRSRVWEALDVLGQLVLCYLEMVL